MLQGPVSQQVYKSVGTVSWPCNKVLVMFLVAAPVADMVPQ